MEHINAEMEHQALKQESPTTSKEPMAYNRVQHYQNVQHPIGTKIRLRLLRRTRHVKSVSKYHILVHEMTIIIRVITTSMIQIMPFFMIFSID